jgi:hypothetical protein
MALSVPRSLHSWIEALLPWYEPKVEALRDAHTERITRRSEAARARAERVIAEYRVASGNLIEEARK